MKRSATTCTVLLIGAVLAGAGLARPQEGGQEPEFVLPETLQDDQLEMIRLFHEVERTLEAIDVELADAGAGRIPPPEGRESGIERLLRSHGEKSDQAVSGIEQILELAAKMNGQSGGT